MVYGKNIRKSIEFHINDVPKIEIPPELNVYKRYFRTQWGSHF